MFPFRRISIKGVVTLSGHVASDAEKTHASQIAQSFATAQVVANEVAVLPTGDTGDAKTINADIDKGVDNNLDAVLISGGFRSGIHHSVKNGVVTLTGTVDTENERAQVESLTKSVPHTQQVCERNSDPSPEGHIDEMTRLR